MCSACQSELLMEISIVDTPGTNAINRAHEAITSQFVPRSDLVLFITSVDRPFTESERAFLEHIRDWGKKVVIVINKIDILESETELQQVAAVCGRKCTRHCWVSPPKFSPSAPALPCAPSWANRSFGKPAVLKLWKNISAIRWMNAAACG